MLYALNTMINPITKHLGWTTRLRVSDVLDGQPIMLERNERVSMLSVHHVIIARKGELAAA